MVHAATVLLLSRVTGQDVLGPDGRVIGRLADLTADLVEESGPALVDRIVVRQGRRSYLLLPWATVANLGHNQLVLTVDADDTARYAVDDVAEALGEHEILLARDVLDTQIVDVVGQRLARVADVVLARTPGGGLELLGVEVGFGGVLRRLRLPAPARAGEDIVAWSDLHLTSERGHSVQLGTPRAAVHHLNARGLAELVSRVDTESATEILTVTDADVAAEVVRAAHPSVGERILRDMPEHLAARVLAAMPAEYARRWRDTLTRAPGRRFLRSHVWPRRRHTDTPAS